MDVPSLTTTLLVVAHVAITITIVIRVLMKRPPAGVAVAWIFIASVLPYVGVILYLLIGERRVSHKRAERLAALRPSYRKAAEATIAGGHADVDWSRHDPAARGIDRIGCQLVGMPTVKGNVGELFADAPSALTAMIRDIDNATTSILMEFYIWARGGLADEVLEALVRAAGRGVMCYVLVDAIGGRPWFRSDQPKRLRQAGVKLLAAMPVGPIRTIFERLDMRLHRKIAVFDGHVAWTGSMNLVDPRFFKQDAGVGEWVDAMVRIEGPAVAALGGVMLGDWVLETGEPLAELVEQVGLRLGQACHEGPDTADVQVVPSGPSETGDGLLQMTMALIAGAREELVITTPYFIPDVPLLAALRGAAARGVTVRLIVPERVDSLLTRFASRSYFQDLIDVGVSIHLYRGGLLHTKSIVADRRLTAFGTANFDMRSLWLNYEVMLFVYGERFGNAIRNLQERYIEKSRHLDGAEWNRRRFRDRLTDNVFRLASPLL